MKYYFKGLLVLILTIFVFGFAAPWLLSAASTILCACGFMLIFVVYPFVMYALCYDEIVAIINYLKG